MRRSVVCGAWHAPALTQSTRAADDELLKGLSKVKVRATWTPWTHARLTSASGYGAGVVAPGWYAHLWQAGDDAVERWYAKAARTLRDHDLAASSACVVEAVRLGTALASLRGRPSAGLPETLDSIRAVFGGGHDEVLDVLRDDLLVGDAFGELPDGLAQLPLEADLQAEQRRLRLKPTAAKATVELDLREPGGRARSVLLHRLCALRVPWGTKEGAGRTRGTFKEVWTLQWQPELALALVDASAFGNTIESAANARLVRADGDDSLPGLVSRLELALLSELHAASRALLAAVQAASATSTDAIALFDAVPPLCRLVRYGNVRDSDLADVRAIAIGLATRVHVALPAACVGVDDDAARSLGERLRDHDTAIELLGEASVREAANATFVRIAHSDPAHAQLRGVAVRLLQRAGAMSATDVAVELERQLSAGSPPSDGATWLDGLLAGSGALLAHDVDLLRCVDAWVGRLGDEHFRTVLPLVRRTFATFSGPERLAIATAVRRGETGAPLRASSATDGFAIDGVRARAAVAAVARWFDLPEPEPEPERDA